MKKVFVILFVALLTIGAAGCGGGGGGGGGGNGGNNGPNGGAVTTYVHFHDQNRNPLVVTLTYSSPSNKVYSVTTNASGDAVVVSSEVGTYIVNRIDYPTASATYVINNVTFTNSLSDLQNNLVTKYDVTIDRSGNSPGSAVSFIRTQ